MLRMNFPSAKQRRRAVALANLVLATKTPREGGRSNEQKQQEILNLQKKLGTPVVEKV